MKNKVLIKLFVPEIDYTVDVFIPVNEVIWKINKMLVKSISDLTLKALDTNINYVLINKDTGKQYDNNDIVINTDIRNASEIIILSIKDNTNILNINYKM